MIQSLIKRILQTADHPLTQLLVKYQRQTFEKLRPILQDYQELVQDDTIIRGRSCSDSSANIQFGRCFSHQSITSAGSGQNNQTFHPLSPRQPSNDSTDAVNWASNLQSPQSSITVFTAPTSRLLTSPLSEDYDIEDFDDLFDDDVECTAASEENSDDQSVKTEKKDTEAKSENQVHILMCDSENSPAESVAGKIKEDSEAEEMPEASGGGGGAAAAAKNKCIEDSVRELERDALEILVRNIAHDVLGYLEEIQTMFIVAYEQLDNAEGRDLCYSCVEEPFFKPIWRYLLALFR